MSNAEGHAVGVPLCGICGYRKAQKAKRAGTYRNKCYTCSVDPEVLKAKRERRNKNRFPYSKYKQDSCQKCGFVAEHPCQLDVDHIDGNHANNDPSNLQTLCANCHRLKTWVAKDGYGYRKV